ncbi:sigma-54-dependent Fis family transcriptional regulator [Clostridium sediminicola]|uniref:sigma-54 interaction domain-containing protein n=1 Tax=Clostridium sediminicola TaxID=3114879 RepID=UPI0031F2671A
MVEIHKNTILREEWHNFIKNGQVPHSLTKEVLSSWERSKEFKVNPFDGKSEIILSKDNLDKKLNDNKTLIHITKPFMQKIYQNIKGFGYIIFLTDNNGNLLHTIGDEKVKKSFKENLNFTIGASWSEQAVGTTAVSMAICKQNSIPFMAEEKYCFELKKRACSAVPIKNIDDEMIGILGVAANFPDPNHQIYGILLGAQMAIENQLRIMKTNTSLHIISHYYKAIFHSVSDPIITIDNKGIITDINEKAKESLNNKSGNIVGKKVKEVLNCYPVILDAMKSGKTYSNDNPFLIDFKDKKFHYNLKNAIPIIGGNGEIHGCINILKKIKKDKIRIVKKSLIDSKAKYTFNNIIGSSKNMKKIKTIAKTAAKSLSNILITGESGTGKEYFAQAIHNASSRAKGPFIAINCGAIPNELIDSEFFGYEGGSFTGARKEGSAGKFELASGGTIFLDEIGEMPKDLQIRLLRILQEREVTRIGGSKRISVDIRIIAATNKNLTQEIKVGSFRQDLFWRLNVISINIPKLSQRKEDIPLLTKHFIEKHSKKIERKYILSKDSLHILLNYNWPGNVRELENCIERALLFVDNNVILPEHLPEYLTYAPEKVDFYGSFSLTETEKQTIERVLHESGKNLTKAAKLLGISRPTLYSKLKKYKISC